MRRRAAQVGAFLIAMRFKMESVTELASFTAAARSYVAPLPIPQDVGVVDLPSYAGKQDTFHALAGAAILAAAAGGAVLMHGYDGIPAVRGTLASSRPWVFRLISSQSGCEHGVRKHGFAYLDIALYHPPVYRFLEMRQELGVRNVFHPIARLLNPARASSQVVGLHAPAPFRKNRRSDCECWACRERLVISGRRGRSRTCRLPMMTKRVRTSR